MALPINPNRPANWSCPVEAPASSTASCEAVDKLNDYGPGGTIATGVNADLARIDAHDPTMQVLRGRNANANVATPKLQDSARVMVDTSAWVTAPGLQKVELTRNPGTWFERAKQEMYGHSQSDVTKALAQAKRNAAEFARNVFIASGGDIKHGGEPMTVRIVPTASTRDAQATLGKYNPWADDDNLKMTNMGVDIGIDPATLRVPTVEELTEQWNSGKQFDDEKLRASWSFLNPNGSLQSGVRVLHGALIKTASAVAEVLGKDLRGAKALLGKPATPATEKEVKEQLKTIVRSQTVERAPKPGQPKASSTELDSVEKTIDKMTWKQTNSFVSNWLKGVEDPNTQTDALNASMQITRNVTMKSSAKAGLVAVANAHNIDVVAQVMGRGNGARFTHLATAPVQTENYEVTAEAKLVAVATSDAVRVFAQIGGVMSDNKLLGTGTLQEALASHAKALRAAAAARAAKAALAAAAK